MITFEDGQRFFNAKKIVGVCAVIDSVLQHGNEASASSLQDAYLGGRFRNHVGITSLNSDVARALASNIVCLENSQFKINLSSEMAIANLRANIEAVYRKISGL